MSRIPEVRLQPSDPYGSAVLDAKTGEVVAKLENNGVYPFNEFKLRLDDDRLGDRSGGIESRSIYHMIGDPEIAEIAFRLGFRDLDATFHEELREQDEALLRKLDQLIVEFMEQFSLEDCSLSQFIRVHWFPRMEQVMCELKMDDEDEPEFSLSDLFDLGV
ncbi:hypothetical protein MGN70_007307 [Eutypa lata]|nr:hypothetical protein MGN70_007307 [Eutypa lata]